MEVLIDGYSDIAYGAIVNSARFKVLGELSTGFTGIDAITYCDNKFERISDFVLSSETSSLEYKINESYYLILFFTTREMTEETELRKIVILPNEQ